MTTVMDHSGVNFGVAAQ